jgi:hypothetical protein
MTEPAIPVHRWGPADARDGLHHLGPCYLGHRSPQGCFVLVMPRECALLLRLDVRNHSPAGFEWGYEGSGPAQLALALLLDALGEPGRPYAIRLYQTFKRKVISHMIDVDSWLIYKEDIIAWAEEARP